MLKEPISKKQKMNVITHVIAYQWVLSLLSEDKIKNIDSSEVIKKVLSSNKKKIMNVTLSEVLDA